jgi:hypothetical protein
MAVNVLQVMTQMESDLRGNFDMDATELLEARDAVAELIEAAEAVVERDTDSPLWMRLEAALARAAGVEL